MKKYYHVFYACDYKGGELESRTNATLEEVIDIVYSNISDDLFDNIDLKTITEFSDEELWKKIEDLYGEGYSMYAGYNGRSYPEIYKIANGKSLERVGLPKEEILNYFKKIIKEVLEDEEL